MNLENFILKKFYPNFFCEVSRGLVTGSLYFTILPDSALTLTLIVAKYTEV